MRWYYPEHCVQPRAIHELSEHVCVVVLVPTLSAVQPLDALPLVADKFGIDLAQLPYNQMIYHD